jgi:uncharacterized short protein YbdD (DUF466 family)
MRRPAAAPGVAPRLPSAREWLRRAARALRLIVGAPDYEGYLCHMRQRHPDRPPLARSEFERQRLEGRYSRPGARCC